MSLSLESIPDADHIGIPTAKIAGDQVEEQVQTYLQRFFTHFFSGSPHTRPNVLGQEEEVTFKKATFLWGQGPDPQCEEECWVRFILTDLRGDCCGTERDLQVARDEWVLNVHMRASLMDKPKAVDWKLREFSTHMKNLIKWDCYQQALNQYGLQLTLSRGPIDTVTSGGYRERFMVLRVKAKYLTP